MHSASEYKVSRLKTVGPSGIKIDLWLTESEAS